MCPYYGALRLDSKLIRALKGPMKRRRDRDRFNSKRTWTTIRSVWKVFDGCKEGRSFEEIASSPCDRGASSLLIRVWRHRRGSDKIKLPSRLLRETALTSHYHRVLQQFYLIQKKKKRCMRSIARQLLPIRFDRFVFVFLSLFVHIST